MATSKCNRCGEEKPLDMFVKNPAQPNGREKHCKPCRNAYLRRYNVHYTKTKFGFLMRAYRNMKSRVEGVQWQKSHLYAGKPLLPKEQFYEWAITRPEFHELFAAWEASGYARQYTPSIDRMDSSRGYELDNMEWVTHSENSRRGSASRVRQGAIPRKITLDAVRDIRSSSARKTDLAKKYGICVSTVYQIRAGKRWKNVGQPVA